ncbi:MAG: ACT domain-containing protein [Blastocatellia bacterium]
MKVKEILKNVQIEVATETFTIVSLHHEDWKHLLQSPELSPRMTTPFMIFMDKNEVTLLLDDVDFGTIRHSIRDAKVESGFRMLTFDTIIDFAVVGFMAEVSRILAEAGVSIVALSAFSRDHLLVKQNDLSTALKALGPHVSGVC